MPSHPFIESVYFAFGEVGKAAAIQELKVRLLADRTKDLAIRADDKSVGQVETAVLDHYFKIGYLSDKEIRQISFARQIRNSLLHGEFDVAFDRIERAAGLKIPPTSDLALNVGERKGEELLNFIFDAVERRTSVAGVEPLRITNQEPQLFRRLLDLFQSGALDLAQRYFLTTTEIIDRVADQAAKAEM